MIGSHYDSNVYSRPAGASILIPGYDPGSSIEAENTTIDDNDFAHQEVAVLKHLYDRHSDWGGAIKNDVMIFHKGMEKYSDKNILFLGYSPAWSKMYKQHQIDFALSFDTLWYGGDHYMSIYGLYPKHYYTNGNNIVINSFIKAQKKLYAKENRDRDAWYYEANSLLNYYVNNIFSWKIGGAIQFERKVAGELGNVDFNALQFQAQGSFSLPYNVNLDFKMLYKDILYQDNDIIFLEVQHDKLLSLAAVVSKKLNDDFSIQVSYDNIETDSNIDAYTYEKHLITVDFIYLFEGV